MKSLTKYAVLLAILTLLSACSQLNDHSRIELETLSRMDVSGTFAAVPFTDDFIRIVQAPWLGDPNFIATRTIEGTIEGDFAGELFITETVETRFTEGRMQYAFQATQVCVCTVNGREGTFTMRLQGRGDDTTFVGTWVIIGNGTGDLAGLRGNGTLTGRRVREADWPPGYFVGEGEYTGTITLR